MPWRFFTLANRKLRCEWLNSYLPNIKVADFGGTLGLFLGVSFITIWDNFHFLDILDILRSKCKRVDHKIGAES